VSEAPLVLIVEDDPTVQGMLRALMEAEGYETTVAADGLEGLLRAELRRPQAILLDVMMPDVDGERVLAELRQRPDLRDVPVLVITGRADAHAAFDPVVGPANVFPKPFDPDALVRRVGEAIAEARP
jgi:CheY-like chemotaxis protein